MTERDGQITKQYGKVAKITEYFDPIVGRGTVLWHVEMQDGLAFKLSYRPDFGVGDRLNVIVQKEHPHD